MFKIQLAEGEFLKNKSGRVQHYKSNDKAATKISNLGARNIREQEWLEKDKKT